ncbi:MAG: hypothetical protein J6Q94_08540 [Clostridia bacterium]|nr:hypothetical protein [Clostridia bacterium]
MKKSTLKILIACILIVATSISFAVVHYVGINKLSAYFSAMMFSSDFKDKIPLSTKNYDLLDDNEKKAYICIFNNIEKHPEYIKIPNLSQSEFNSVYFAVKNDNPDMLCFSDSCNMITFLSSCFLQMHYDYPEDICIEMSETLDAKVNSIIDGIDVSDDYSTELAIHDYIVKNCTYTENAENASNAYGCLIDGEAVCSGYSRATMLLLNKAGIESVLVGGTGITSDNEVISHMWNIVWIDGSPYHLDVTWDDPGNANNTISHIFFNVTTEQISTDHKDISSAVECTATDANFFVKENTIYYEYNKTVLHDIMNNLCTNINNGVNYSEFIFVDSDAYNSAVDSIINNSKIGSDMYKIIEYVAENAKNEVDISHINFVQESEKNYIRLMFDEI